MKKIRKYEKHLVYSLRLQDDYIHCVPLCYAGSFGEASAQGFGVTHLVNACGVDLAI